MLRSALFFVLALSLLGCSGGASYNKPPPPDSAPVVVIDLEAQKEAAEAARLEAERKAAEEAKKKADFERFLEEAERQAAEAEARRQAEVERQRREAERQARLAAERAMGIRADATVTVTTGDETLPLPEFRNREVYLPWGVAVTHTPAPERLSYGPWSDASMNIHADMGAMSFGVRQDPDNRMLTPWFSGPAMHGDTIGLRIGGMVWEGPLVGLTPSGRAVTGRATLSHYSADRAYFGDGYVTFDLNFDNLAYRDTGTTWGDGDLFYLVGQGWGAGNAAVLNKTFTYPYKSQRYKHPVDPKLDVFPYVGFAHHERPPTPLEESQWADYRGRECCIGDEGEVRGMFLGPKHEGMAGSLVRDDLTAAFGGTRQGVP